MSSAKRRAFCISLNVLTHVGYWVWVGDYIRLLYVNVITYPCHNHYVGLAKLAPDCEINYHCIRPIAWSIVDSRTSCCNFVPMVVRLVAVRTTNRTNSRADSRFGRSQWETALICNAVSHWLGANLESTLNNCRDVFSLGPVTWSLRPCHDLKTTTEIRQILDKSLKIRTSDLRNLE